MKLHELADKIKIEKETDNAVFVNSKEMTEKDYKTVQDIWWLGVNVYIKKDGFYEKKEYLVGLL